MARTFDEKPFHPVIPEELRAGEKVERIREALWLIYKELDFQLSALGPENFNEPGLRSLSDELGITGLVSLASRENDGKVIVIRDGAFAAVYPAEILPRFEVDALSSFDFADFLSETAFAGLANGVASSAVSDVESDFAYYALGFTFTSSAVGEIVEDE